LGDFVSRKFWRLSVFRSAKKIAGPRALGQLLAAAVLAGGFIAVDVSSASAATASFGAGHNISGAGGKVATSQNGAYVLFTSDNRVFISADGGTTMSERPQFANQAVITAINSVSISANGQVMAVATNRGVYTSSDFGNNWANQVGETTLTGWHTAVSADGSTVFRSSSDTNISRQVNGTTWSSIPRPLGAVLGIRSNVDGSQILLSTTRGLYKIYASADTPAELINARNTLDFDASSSLQHIVVVQGPSFRREVSVSNDGGASWRMLSFLSTGGVVSQKRQAVISDDGQGLIVTYNDGMELFDFSERATQPVSYFGGFLMTPIAADMSADGARSYVLSAVGRLRVVDFVPRQVRGLESRASDGAATLSWTEEVNNTTPTTDYLVEYSTNKINWIQFDDGVSTATQATVTGLSNGTQYFFRVAAVNKRGRSALWAVDATGSFPFGQAEPAAIVSVTGGPNQVSIEVDQNPNGLIFNWINFQVFNAVTDELVLLHSEGQSMPISKNPSQSLQQTFVINSGSLVNGVSYYVRTQSIFTTPLESWSGVAGVNRLTSSLSTRSQNFTAADVPSAPAALSVSPATNSLMASWSPPASNGGLPILGYRLYLNGVERVSVGGNNLFEAAIEGIQSTCAEGAICWGAGYTVGVAAYNIIGTGPIETVGPYDPLAPLTVPEVPRSLRAAAQSQAIFISWGAPEQSGGTEITGYKLSYRIGAGGTKTFIDLAAAARSHEITGLTNYQDYEIELQANNAVGLSTPAITTGTPFAAPGSLGIVAVSSAANGGAFAEQPSFSLRDNASPNAQVMVRDNSSTVVATVSAGGILLGNTVAPVLNGLATFENLGLAGVAGQSYTITYTAHISPAAYPGHAATAQVKVSEVRVAVVGPAVNLVLSQPAVGSEPGRFATQPSIQITDIAGNQVSTTHRVTASGVDQVFGSPATVWQLNAGPYIDTSTGVALFADLGFTYASSFELVFSAPGLKPVSQTVNPIAGAPNGLEPAVDLTMEPNAQFGHQVRIVEANLGEVFATQPEYQITDSAGVPVSNYVGTVSVSTDLGTLLGDTTVTVLNGRAVFRGLSIVGVPVDPDSQRMVLITASAEGLNSRSISFFVKPGNYEVSFDGNGSEDGAPPSSLSISTASLGDAAAEVALPGAGELSRSGYSFEGWGLAPTSTMPVTLTNADLIGNLELFAIWQLLPTRSIEIQEIGTKRVGDNNVVPEVVVSVDGQLGDVAISTNAHVCVPTADGQVQIVGPGTCEVVVVLSGEGSYQVALASTSFEVLEAQVVGGGGGGGGFVAPAVPEADTDSDVDAAPAAARGWTRAFADGTVKFYARDLVGAGKVRFVLNGREVAWVRAVDATDPKLNVGPAAARDGLVRTVGPGSRWSLVDGRNVLEIYVGENRLVRRIFTQ